MAVRPTKRRTCALPVSFRALPENEIPPVEAPSVRKVPQLYSWAASYIASQLYDATHRDIVLWTVKVANIISRKPIGFHITLQIRQNITVRPVSQYHLSFLSLRQVDFKVCNPL